MPLPKIEVHVDHVRNVVAIEWPDRPGYWFINANGDRFWGEDAITRRDTLPAGMTRLVDPTPAEQPAPAKTVDLAVVPRQPGTRYRPLAAGEA